MIRTIIAATLLASAAPAAAQGAVERAERALNLRPNGEPAPYVDRGPANVKIGTGTFLLRILPADQVRAMCPAGIDWHSRACTRFGGIPVVLMPDEDSSGLTADQWLDELRHEILHATGVDFHGPRP